jgi:predicted TPR repeat methyltransferase
MNTQKFKVKIPETDDDVVQGEEQFIIEYNGEKTRVRAHDYDRIYSVPGLYEYLFYDKYKCKSPKVVCSLLEKEVQKTSMEVSDLKVLDVGAGNGMVGEELKSTGADTVVGLDIIEEAAEATERDRPGVYADYFTEDLTRLPDSVKEKIEELSPNCLTVVAALGFDDIPPDAFIEAYNMISEPGWVAFNIKDEFYSPDDRTGFSCLIDRMMDDGIFKMNAKKRYCHRFCQDGTPLHYYAVVGRKEKDIPAAMISQL